MVSLLQLRTIEQIPMTLARYALAFTYSEHFSATHGAYPLSRRFPILHSDGFSVLHLPFGTTFYTVCLHYSPPPFVNRE